MNYKKKIANVASNVAKYGICCLSIRITLFAYEFSNSKEIKGTIIKWNTLTHMFRYILVLSFSDPQRFVALHCEIQPVNKGEILFVYHEMNIFKQLNAIVLQR